MCDGGWWAGWGRDMASALTSDFLAWLVVAFISGRLIKEWRNRK